MKKGTIVMLVVFLFLVLTNPSLRDFKEYAGCSSFSSKEHNFLVCSTFRDGGTIYLGVIKNFFALNVGVGDDVDRVVYKGYAGDSLAAVAAEAFNEGIILEKDSGIKRGK